MKSKSVIIIFIAVIGGLLAWQISRQVMGSSGTQLKDKNAVVNNAVENAVSTNSLAVENKATRLRIIKRWELPDELLEISALSYIDEDRFACVQDEKGSIYIYNTSSEKIDQEISFAEAGDYEGLTVVGTTAYVVNSGGRIFEVQNFLNKNKAIKEYATALSTRENIEGLCFDKEHNRLLMAVKDKDPNSTNYKGIYSFDLNSKKFVPDVIYRIDLENELFSEGKKKKSKNEIHPSAITIKDGSGDVYIMDGPASRLLILNKEGSIKSLINLDKKEFPQPEGVTFNSKEQLFISNEGSKKKSGTIIQAELTGE